MSLSVRVAPNTWWPVTTLGEASFMTAWPSRAIVKRTCAGVFAGSVDEVTVTTSRKRAFGDAPIHSSSHRNTPLTEQLAA